MTDKSNVPEESTTQSDLAELKARREFLAKCGRFAVVTPPLVTTLLSTSLSTSAIAQSGGGANGGGSINIPSDILNQKSG